MSEKPNDAKEQPASDAEEQPASDAEEQPASDAEEQPASDAEEQPASDADEQPASDVDEQPASDVDEQPDDAATNDAEERLANVRAEIETGRGSSGRLLLFAAPVLVLAVGVLYFLPSLLDPAGRSEQMLQRSLVYCKFERNHEACTAGIRARHEMCTERAHNQRSSKEDVYGPCMEEVFPRFYMTIAENLPKTLDPGL